MRSAVAWITIFAVCAFFPACRPRSPAAIRTIRIAYVGSVTQGQPVLTGIAAIVVADGWLEGELAKRGAQVSWVPMPNASVGPSTNEAFAGGRIDFAGYGDLPSIIANAAGVHTKLVVPGGRGTDAYLLVPPDSQAKSILDLKGKRIAVHRGRPWELPLARLVESAGLTYADFSVVNIDPEAGAAALAAGKVDALCTMSSAYVLQDKGVGKIIWSTADSPPDWKTLGGLWASADFVAREPELTQLVVTAYVKAAAWASREENRDHMIELATRNGASASVVRREYETGSWRERWSPIFEPWVLEHYRSAIAYTADKRIIEHPFDFRDSYDDRFVLHSVDDLKLHGYWAGD